MANLFDKIKDFLVIASLGKYQTQLFHNGKSYFSTFIGGILTLILVTLLSY